MMQTQAAVGLLTMPTRAFAHHYRSGTDEYYQGQVRSEQRWDDAGEAQAPGSSRQTIEAKSPSQSTTHHHHQISRSHPDAIAEGY